MELKEIGNGLIVLELDPGICLAIAEACRAASAEATERERMTHAGVWRVLGSTFNAFALIGAAKQYGPRIEMAEWNEATVAEGWSILPQPQGGR